MKKSMYIMISVLILALSVCFVDAVIMPNYVIKSMIKIIFYLLIPMIYFVFDRDGLKKFRKLFIPNKKDFVKTLLLALFIYFSIVFGYFLVRNFIDFSLVTSNLVGNMGIDSYNFIYVTIYIAFINSFLEEFFYRGYAFITLKEHVNKIFAHIFSASLFAFYHVGMMLESFHFPVIILMTVGLFCGGLLFNYLTEKSNNIYTAWIVHMFTNFGINTVGFILFGLM